MIFVFFILEYHQYHVLHSTEQQDDKLERIWKDVVMVLFKQLAKGTDKMHDNFC
jgi:hypothetical protein